MFDFDSNPYKAKKPVEETEVVTEMCDVCGHSFLTQNIKRYHGVGKLTGTHYVVRCCPHCSPVNLLANL